MSLVSKVSTFYVGIAGSPASSNSYVAQRAREFSDRSTASVSEEDKLN